MKIHYIILLLVTICSSCKQTEMDLQIPDNVMQDNSIERVRMPGTKVMLHKSENFVLYKELLRIQKDENTFIKILEIPTSFTDYINELKETVDKDVKDGKTPKPYYQKEFKLGIYNAMIYYCASDKPNSEDILLVFGDSEFTVMATGKIPSENESARDEVLKELLNISIDKSLKDDAMEYITFELNTTNSIFKYNSKLAQAYCYTVDGKGNPSQDVFGDNIMVIPQPPISKSMYEEKANDIISRMGEQGISVNSKDKKNIMIGGNSALEFVMNTEFQNRKSKTYVLVTSNDKNGIIILGAANNQIEETLPQIVNISRTLKIK